MFPIICAQYEESKLINKLNNFFKFDHNIVLLDSLEDANRFANMGGIVPQSFYVFKRTKDNNITGLEKLTEIRSKNTFTIVLLENGTFQSNLNFLHQFKTIQRLHVNMKIGIFFSQFVSINDLRHLFEWCKEHLIIKIFAAVTHPPQSQAIQEPIADPFLNIFTFNPFGRFDVINITSETCENYFRIHNYNFQQHQLRLGLPFFWTINEVFWLTVFRLMNASFVVDQKNFTLLSQMFANGIDIIPHLNVQNFRVLNVYPMMTVPLGFAVPEALPYPQFSSYLLTLISNDLIGLSLFTIIAVVLILIIFRYIKQKRILCFESVADVLNLLMNDNGYIKYQRLSSIEVFLIVPLTFAGLIVVNGILSELQSYLTRPVIQPQINTIEDIYSSSFPIMTYGEHLKTVLTEALGNLTKYKDWSEKIFVLPLDEFTEHFISYNASESYFVTYKDIEHIQKAQKRLDIRGYHVPQINILGFYTSYFVNDKFLFFERLNEIMFLIKSSGLWELWWRNEDDYQYDGIMKKNLENIKNEENDIERFPFPVFMFYGWSVSTVVFLIEVISKKFKFSKLFFKKVFQKWRFFCMLRRCIRIVDVKRQRKKNLRKNRKQIIQKITKI